MGFRPHQTHEIQQYFSARGSKSRNKVAVGEPAAGSFPKSILVFQACPGITVRKPYMKNMKAKIPKHAFGPRAYRVWPGDNNCT